MRLTASTEFQSLRRFGLLAVLAASWFAPWAAHAQSLVRIKIAAASKVANPGCYPTGAIALIRPLVDAGLMAADHPVTINAVSGYSGGGKAMIEAHDSSGGPSFELYGLGFEHKHVPETQLYAGLSRRPIFIPSVGHFRQGMLVSIPLHLDTLAGKPTGADLNAILAAYFKGSADPAQ